MKPRKVNFYLYAQNEQEINDLQDALFEFVSDMYSEGVLVTANRVKLALNKFADNFMVKQFLKM